MASAPPALPPPPADATAPPQPPEKKEFQEIDSPTHKEIQRLCAAFTLHSCRGRTYGKTELKKELQKRYHGDANVSSQIEDFIKGKNRYRTLQKKADVHNTGLSSESGWETVLHEDFRRGNDPLVYGDNLTMDVLARSAKSNAKSTIKGESLYKFAREEICEALKIQVCVSDAVRAGIVAGPTDGLYQFASGKNDSDLIHFLFFRMNNFDLYYGPSGGGNELDEANGKTYSTTWFPKGWFLFWLVGNHPSNDPDNQIDLAGMDHTLEEKSGGGRKEQRSNDKKDKDSDRDYGVGNSNEGRGLAYGAASYKDLALVEQNKRKLDQQKVAGRIAVLSTLIKSKHDTIASVQTDVDRYMTLDMREEAKELMKSLSGTRNEIKKLEEELLKLQNITSENESAHTEQFLQLGAEATRMGKRQSGKKRAAEDEVDLGSKSNESNVEEDGEDDIEMISASGNGTQN